MAYTDVPLLVEPDDLLAQVYDYLRARIPEWDPAEGNLDVWLAEAFAQLASQVAEMAADVPRSIYRTYGPIAGVPPIDATAATGTTTWTFTAPTADKVISAGTPLTIADVAFELTSDLTVTAGQTQATGVPIIATDPGAAGSGLSGLALPGEAFDFVDTVTVAGQTSGGADAEDDDTYLDRLTDELRLSTPRVVRAADAAVYARRYAGIERCLAIDLLNPDDGTTNNAKYVALFPVDAAGQPVSSTVAAQLVADLTAQREPGFVFKVAAPTYTPVGVTFDITVFPGFDGPTVKAAAIAALQAYLSPQNWGQPSGGQTRQWVSEAKVRYLEVAQVLQDVEGLRYVNSLSINGQASGQDVTLPGAAPMPTPGTMTGTVS